MYLQKQEKRKRKLPKARLKEQPCFVKYNLGNSLFQRYSKFIVLIKAFYVSFKPYQFNNETKRSKLVFRACFCYLWEQRCLFSQEKRQSCLKVTLKSIRRTSRAWSTHFDLALAPTAEVVRLDFQERRGGRLPPRLFWTDSGMCEGAAYGKAVPSRLSHLSSAS